MMQDDIVDTKNGIINNSHKNMVKMSKQKIIYYWLKYHNIMGEIAHATMNTV